MYKKYANTWNNTLIYNFNFPNWDVYFLFDEGFIVEIQIITKLLLNQKHLFYINHSIIMCLFVIYIYFPFSLYPYKYVN